MSNSPRLSPGDRRLITALQRSPRGTTRSLAAEADLDESVAAIRIRGMIERNMIRPSVTYDWMRAGYHGSVALSANVDYSAPGDPCGKLHDLENVISAVTMLGEYQLLLHVLLSEAIPTPSDARARIDALPGLYVEQSESVLDTCITSRSPQQLRDAMTDFPLLPAPVVSVDEIDRSVCVALGQNARTSTRNLAHMAGTSEQTVRLRLARLQESGLIRLSLLLDRSSELAPSVTAEVGLKVSGAGAAVVAELHPDEQVQGCVALTGKEQLRLRVSASSIAGLRTYVSKRVAVLPNVRSTSVHIVAEQELLDQRWG